MYILFIIYLFKADSKSLVLQHEANNGEESNKK